MHSYPVITPRAASAALGLLGLAVGTFVLWSLPGQIGAESLGQAVDASGPGFFPILAALVAMGAGVWCLVEASLAKGHLGGEPLMLRRSGWVVAVLLLGWAGLHTIGMLASLGVMSAGLAVAFGARRAVPIVALSLLTPAAIHLLFEKTLKILLPAGWVL
jgi:hypothetical protein